MRALRKIFKWTLIVLGLAIAAIVIKCLIPISPTIATIKPRPNTQYWTMSKGYRLAYTHAAAQVPSDNPPIVFLHGGPGGYVHSSTITLLSRLSEQGFDVYFYDQAGCGLSDRLARPKDYTFLGHVADLREIVVDHLQAERVILIGHSYGGQLAAQFTAMEPARVARLILSSPGTLEPSIWENGRWVNEDKYPCPDSLHFVNISRVAMDGLGFWTMRGMASMALSMTLNVKLMSDEEGDGLLNTLASRFTVNMVCDSTDVLPEEGGAGWYAHGWSNWYGDLEDPRPAMHQCTMPVLVLQGSCDYIPYHSTYEYVDLFPNARYAFIEGAGHIIWWDKPEEYLGQISQFVGASTVDTSEAP